MTQADLLAKTWFYRFPLPGGAVTPSYHDGALDAVHTTRVDMMARALREHFGDAPIASAVDLACHQGWFSWQLTQHGVQQVTGIEPRTEHVADARAVTASDGPGRAHPHRAVRCARHHAGAFRHCIRWCSASA
jgi:tRNA (mo5U34)-methyltransferase